jgi:hypothetical protein
LKQALVLFLTYNHTLKYQEAHMGRKVALVLVSFYVVIASAVVLALFQATPGPSSQDIQGVAIGTAQSSEGIAYISGKRLACRSLEQPNLYTSHCSITIAGKHLTLLAGRNAPSDFDQFGGRCQAQYDGQTWPCHFGFRHVHTPWFAYLDTSLGLSARQLDELRRQYWIENLPEAAFLQFIAVSAVLTTIVAAGSAVLWLWPTRQNKLVVVGVVGVISLLVCFSSGIATLVMTSRFWD